MSIEPGTPVAANGGAPERAAAVEAVKRELLDRGVEFALAAWVDTIGKAKAKFVPIDGVDKMLHGRGPLYGVHAIEGMGKYGPADPDQTVRPDLDTLTICPWDPRVAWFSGDIMWRDGTPYPLCARTVLKRQIERARQHGLQLQVGIEPEVYVYRKDTNGAPLPLAATDVGGTRGYDVDATFAAFGFLEDVVAAFRQLGWPVDAFVHEGGHAQYEFDYGYGDALVAADKWIFIKEMLRRIADRHDAFVTFMAKPFNDSFRSGAHYNMSLWNVESGENVFEDEDDPRGFGMSRLAYSFVAGQLKHADAITAVTCPTVNSYRGLTDASALGGVAEDLSWAPVGITYGVNNRSAMIRLPDGRSCVENRATDPSCNMYLGLAITLAAGLEGIEQDLDPGEPITESLYGMNASEREAKGFRRLPSTLGDALAAFEADPLTEEAFGSELRTAFIDLKRAEWQEYLLHVPQWDRDRYLHAS
ncbi:MAG: glutamine synthetase [bacterium]